MTAFGYVGRVLCVDLTSGDVHDEPLDLNLAREYLGGSGLAAALLSREDVSLIDPLGPKNPLIWMTGPPVGTSMPSAGRVSVCALSPLTEIWGEANAGGFFGPALRFAGYDGIVVRGRAERLVFLSIVDGGPQLHDAGALVGLGTYETQEAVRALLSLPTASVACIGEAGERQVRYAAVLNDHGRAAGRCGLGAVMGSKRLKAVAVSGRASIPVADAEALEATAVEIRAGIEADIAAQAIQMAGTAGYLDMALMYGDLPIRSFRRGEREGAANLSGVRLTEEFLVRGRACYGCSIACGRETRAPRFGLDRVDGPEYETLGALGSLLEIDDLEAVIHAGHLCNVHGLDTISTGVTIALACELFERGLMTETDGAPICYGDANRLPALIERIARREGIGDLLAEGSNRLAARFGVPELAVTVKGLEVPMHDPRAFAGMAVTYALSPRGACHMQGDAYSVDTGQLSVPEAGILPGDRLESSQEKGRTAARTMIWRTIYNALNLCQFSNPEPQLLLRALEEITGEARSIEDLMATGRRILKLKRSINERRGMTSAADRLPEVLLQPLGDGGAQGVVPDLDRLLAGAYDELDWEA